MSKSANHSAVGTVLPPPTDTGRDDIHRNSAAMTSNSVLSFNPDQCRIYFESRMPGVRFNGNAAVMAHCPFHDDARKSLSLDFDKGCWYCHAGCGNGGIVAFEEKLSHCDRATARANVAKLLGVTLGSGPIAIYEYRDALGKLVFRKLRYPDKTFRCQRPAADGKGWIDDLGGIERKPLYREPELICATYVVIVEGEKDCDRLVSLKLAQYDPAGLPVAITCNFDGAGPSKWRREHNPYFTGKNVVIIPDNDEPGREHALAVARGIAPFAAEVKMLYLPGLPEHGDVSDFLDAGHGAPELLVAIEAASPWTELESDAPAPRFKTIAEIVAQSAEKAEWILPHIVERTALTQLAAKIKAGKTSFMMSAIRALITGSPFLGQPTKRGSVVMVSEQSGSSYFEALNRACLIGLDGMTVMQRHDTFGLDWPGIVAAAVAECERTDAVLLIIDTLSQLAGLTGDDENSAGKMLTAMRPLQTACGRGFGVWYSVHERKSGGEVADSARGSSAAGGVADILLSLRRPEGNHGQQDSIRKISSISRFSETPSELVVNWDSVAGEYIILGDSDAAIFDRATVAIMRALPATEIAAKSVPLLREETGESTTTIRRALREIEASRVGDGEKGSPFRYWLRVQR